MKMSANNSLSLSLSLALCMHINFSPAAPTLKKIFPKRVMFVSGGYANKGAYRTQPTNLL